MGVDTSFQHLERVSESDFTLTGLPTGKVTRFQVIAINDAGESQPCAPVEIAVA